MACLPFAVACLRPRHPPVTHSLYSHPNARVAFMIMASNIVDLPNSVVSL